MSDEPVARQTLEPFDYLLYGAIGGFVAGLLLGIGLDQDIGVLTVIGYIGASVASVVFLIGVIAKGVQVGNEATR